MTAPLQTPSILLISQDNKVEEVLKLNFVNRLHVDGDVITGSVDINPALAYEHKLDYVYIKLRGISKVCVQGPGNDSPTDRKKVWLIRQDVPLWTLRSAISKFDSEKLRIPFNFQLPNHLPPSFYVHGDEAQISYSIEAVGRRAGSFSPIRGTGYVFPLIPAATEQEVAVQKHLLSGWTGAWSIFTAGLNIRRGLWGDHSRVDIELRLPDIDSFPMGTPFTFHLRIVTTTKNLNRSEITKHQLKGKEIFPVPPSDSQGITISFNQDLILKGSVTVSRSRQSGRNLISEHTTFMIEKPEWIAVSTTKSEDELGKYRRAVSLSFRVTLDYLPSFYSEMIQTKHLLYLKIPFPGIGNDFTHELPIKINSGIGCPTVKGILDLCSQQTELPSLPRGLRLPPSYWVGSGHDWDNDEQK